MDQTSSATPPSNNPTSWEEVNLEEMTVKALVAMGVEIRDELKLETSKFNAFKKSADGMLLRIGMALKEHGDKLGVDSFKTPEGTAYRNRKESYRVGVWDSILTYIKETENWQMLEKRIGKLATKEIHERTGELPPGVEYVAEEVFVLRRPNEKVSRDE
jgi:hypothetical protein